MSDQNTPTDNTKTNHRTIYFMLGFLAAVISITSLLALAYSATSLIQSGLAISGIAGVVVAAYFGLKHLLNNK